MKKRKRHPYHLVTVHGTFATKAELLTAIDKMPSLPTNNRVIAGELKTLKRRYDLSDDVKNTDGPLTTTVRRRQSSTGDQDPAKERAAPRNGGVAVSRPAGPF